MAARLSAAKTSRFLGTGIFNRLALFRTSLLLELRVCFAYPEIGIGELRDIPAYAVGIAESFGPAFVYT